MTPSSVCTRTKICLRVPPVQGDGGVPGPGWAGGGTGLTAASAGADLLRDEDDLPGREGGGAGDAEGAPDVRVALLVGALHVEDGHVGGDRGHEQERGARPGIGGLLEGRIGPGEIGAE